MFPLFWETRVGEWGARDDRNNKQAVQNILPQLLVFSQYCNLVSSPRPHTTAKLKAWPELVYVDILLSLSTDTMIPARGRTLASGLNTKGNCRICDRPARGGCADGTLVLGLQAAELESLLRESQLVEGLPRGHRTRRDLQ